MKKNVILGLIIGAILVYLSVRGIRFQDVIDGFRMVRYEYVLLPLLIFFFMQVLRAWRWGIILSPIEKVDQLSLFSVTCVGFLAIVAIPARIGELARPYLITKKSQIKMSAAVGTIFVERIFDSFSVLSVFVIVLFLTPLPPWLIKASFIFFLITIMIFTVMILLLVKRDKANRVLGSLFRRFPERYAVKLNPLIEYFIDGFAIIADPKRFFVVMFLSAI
jgi:uncharacterized protein (TIRG00374 family)